MLVVMTGYDRLTGGERNQLGCIEPDLASVQLASLQTDHPFLINPKKFFKF